MQPTTDLPKTMPAPSVGSGDLLGAGASSGYYEGRIYVRPMGRGVVMIDRAGMPHLDDDVLPEGYYYAQIHVSALTPSGAEAAKRDHAAGKA